MVIVKIKKKIFYYYFSKYYASLGELSWNYIVMLRVYFLDNKLIKNLYDILEDKESIFFLK